MARESHLPRQECPGHKDLMASSVPRLPFYRDTQEAPRREGPIQDHRQLGPEQSLEAKSAHHLLHTRLLARARKSHVFEPWPLCWLGTVFL